jgi:hypothetical protein
MASLVRWMMAPDENPSRRPANNTAVIRKEKDKPVYLSRRSTDPDNVTYASKDEQRNVQFVCHLPAGSQHAAQAQKIAGAIFSRRPGDAGDRLLGGSGSADTKLLEDEDIARRREERSAKYRYQSGEAEIVSIRPKSAGKSAVPLAVKRSSVLRCHFQFVKSTGMQTTRP